MKIKYKRVEYSLPFISGLKILLIKLNLIVIRLSRMLKRLVSYAKPLLIVIACLIIYTLLLYIINHNNIYISFFDVLLDIKNTIFTVLFLSYFISSTANEREYRRKIRARHDTYVDTMFGFERSLIKILKLLCSTDGESLGFYNIEQARRLYKKIDSINYSKPSYELYKQNYLRIIDILSSMRDLAIRLHTTRKEFVIPFWDGENNITFSYYITSIQSRVNETIDKIKYEKMDENNYRNFISGVRTLAHTTSSIVDQLRKPWRIDLKKHIAIVNILYPNNKNKLLEDHYLSMLLDLKN